MEKLKLHVACGDVYLTSNEPDVRWVNIDVDGVYAFDVEQNIIDANKTTIDKYFKYKFEQDINKRIRRPVIVDKKMNLAGRWDYINDSVDEVVMISAFEHFYQKDAVHIVKEVSRVLKSGGKFIVDFPDLEKQFKKYFYSNPEFYMELVYCNHKNVYSVHHWGYTPKTFKNLWGSDFKVKKKTLVKHDYPMIGMVVTKL